VGEVAEDVLAENRSGGVPVSMNVMSWPARSQAEVSWVFGTVTSGFSCRHQEGVRSGRHNVTRPGYITPLRVT